MKLSDVKLHTNMKFWTSLMLLCLNGRKSLQQVQYLEESLEPEEWRLSYQPINAHGVYFWSYSVCGTSIGEL